MYKSLSSLINKTNFSDELTIEFKREMPRRNNLADENRSVANANLT